MSGVRIFSGALIKASAIADAFFDFMGTFDGTFCETCAVKKEEASGGNHEKKNGTFYI